MRSIALLGLIVASGTGCEPLAPDVGPAQNARCINEDSDPTTSVSYNDDIAAGIWHPICSKGHDPTADDPIGVQIGGLDLMSHASLLAGGVNSGTNIVIAGQPCDSVLIKKLSASPPSGSRMPFDGPPFLAPEQVQRIADWIAEGAQNN